ncbi:hypothetical protein IMSHALPRED_010302 [Imshaugia aleurites]|uniref:Uncharacterized protein n=1 Tax=Imshaugia aleurites TaxID=172621 RepID=A0A8H3G2U6_9LECA|nr:hypothetical protein IMSHALPRED_010302 [Imshaugia aleurites]
MAVQNPNPNPNPSTTPPTLTAAQTRALLHALRSTTPNAHRPTASAPPSPPTVKVVRHQPVQQQIITIDASTRIMGHCNNVALASPSPTEQAVKIEQLLRGVLQPMGQGEDKARAKADVNLNVTIQAGVNIMGSKNVVLSGKRDVGKDSTKVDDLLLGRKRRAESEPADMQTALGKRVKVEAQRAE